MFKIVLTLFWQEQREYVAGFVPRAFNCTLFSFAEQGLELGKYHFDGLER